MKEDTSPRPKAAANDLPLRVDGDNGGAISDLVASDRPNHLDLVASDRPNHLDLVAGDSAAPPLMAAISRFGISETGPRLKLRQPTRTALAPHPGRAAPGSFQMGTSSTSHPEPKFALQVGVPVSTESQSAQKIWSSLFL